MLNDPEVHYSAKQVARDHGKRPRDSKTEQETTQQEGASKRKTCTTLQSKRCILHCSDLGLRYEPNLLQEEEPVAKAADATERECSSASKSELPATAGPAAQQMAPQHDAMGCGASKSDTAGPVEERVRVECKPRPWDGRRIDHAKEVLLVKGAAVKRLARDKKLGRKTSHDMLRLMHEEYNACGGKEVKDNNGNTVWSCGPSQIEIMEKLGTFTRLDFVVVTFDDLASVQYLVLSYTWNDSKWEELVGDCSDEGSHGLQAELPDMEEEFFWLDIFCLDQFCADKMESIKRSDEIYGWAHKYFGMGLAIFYRVWCLAETTCTGEKAQRRKEMIMVTKFRGFLDRREEAYKDAKIT